MSTPCTLKFKLAIPSDPDDVEAPAKLYLLTLGVSFDIVAEEDCDEADLLGLITLTPATLDGGTSPGTNGAVMPPQDPPLAADSGDMCDGTTH